jgi:hypothetical protein
MAGQTLAAADAILKDLYVGPLVEQLNQKTYLLDQIERDADHIDHTGRRAIVPVHKNRNRGRRSITDGGALAKAGSQQALDAVIPMRYHSQGIELTDQSIEATKKDEGAFISALTWETKGAATDMKKDMNRQAFGLGNGVLFKALKTSKAFELKAQSVYEGQYLYVGDVIDVLIESTGATTNGVVEAEVVAKEITATEAKFTLSKELAAELGAETYAVYIHGNRNNEMDGLRNITQAKRTLHSINSETAGNAFWEGQEQLVGKSVTETSVAGQSSFQQLANKVGSQGNGDVEIFLTTRGIRERLANTYETQKRFNDGKAVDIHGGYSAIMVNEIPVVADDDCPKQYAFGFNKSALKWFELKSPGWLEQSNGGMFNLKPGSGTYEASWLAWWVWYVALGCVAANRTGRLVYCQDDVPNQSN